MCAARRTVPSLHPAMHPDLPCAPATPCPDAIATAVDVRGCFPLDASCSDDPGERRDAGEARTPSDMRTAPAPAARMGRLALAYLALAVGTWSLARLALPATLRWWGACLLALLAIWAVRALQVLAPWIAPPGSTGRAAPLRTSAGGVIVLAILAAVVWEGAGLLGSGLALLGALVVTPLGAMGALVSRGGRRRVPQPGATAARRGARAATHASTREAQHARRTARWLVPGPLVTLAGAALLTAAVLLHPAAWRAAPTGGDPALQLRTMAEADQRDRRLGLFVLDAQRDSVRLARVLALDAAGAVVAPRARMDAALLLQHGRCGAQFRRAWEHATAAARAAVPGAEALARAAYDRWMLAQGRPQRYGTQLATSARAACP